MEYKYSLNNILRAIEFIGRHGPLTMDMANSHIRKYRRMVADKYRLCDSVKGLAGVGDRIVRAIPGELNTDVIYRVFRRDANRFARRMARKINFAELVRELYMNYEECRAHIGCAAMDAPERFPAYKKAMEDDSKWFVVPGVAVGLLVAFPIDSVNKVGKEFIDYTARLAKRSLATGTVPDTLRSKTPGCTGMKVQAMVYTGKFVRRYPIILMLSITISFEGTFHDARILDSDGHLVPIPKEWIPIMVRIPREPRKDIKQNQTQGETTL